MASSGVLPQFSRGGRACFRRWVAPLTSPQPLGGVVAPVERGQRSAGARHHGLPTPISGGVRPYSVDALMPVLLVSSSASVFLAPIIEQLGTILIPVFCGLGSTERGDMTDFPKSSRAWIQTVGSNFGRLVGRTGIL